MAYFVGAFELKQSIANFQKPSVCFEKMVKKLPLTLIVSPPFLGVIEVQYKPCE
jgi:hypothetical protein